MNNKDNITNNNIVSEQFRRYDSFVARTLAFIYKECKDTDKIILSYYNNNNYISNYVLSICFIYSDLENKPIYISGNFLTYLKLKFKYFRKRKLHYQFTFSNDTLCSNAIVFSLADRAKEEITIAKEIYEAYYKNN